MPLVSIGLPVYNGENYLAQALNAILAQDFEDFEVIISDNGSIDGTQDIALSYSQKDKRIRYIRLTENKGAAFNYNNTFNLSTGHYFKWAAHDDIITPTFLRRCVEEFERLEREGYRPSIVYTKSDVIDEEGRVLQPDPNHMNLLSPVPAWRVLSAVQRMGLAAPVFGLMRRDMMERTRLVGRYIGSDYVFILEAAMIERIVQLDDVLFQRRIHAAGSRVANKRRRDLMAWFDPKAKSVLSERQRMTLEYYRSVFVVPDLSVLTRATCLIALTAALSVWWFRRFRVFVGRKRRTLFQSFGQA
ncbi:glycosyltransferase family 2 protein [Acuticoccus sediminis]|nr:glycosyltransferase family 2 protein [Acuticoccus sediminis]